MEKEIKAFMAEHNLKSLPVLYKNDWLGDLTNEMKYKRGFGAYLTAIGTKADKQAVELVYKSLPTIKEVFDKWDKEILITVVYYSDYKPEKESEWEGTLNDVFNRLDRANNSLRYCNGMYYKIKGVHAEELFRFWQHLIPFMQSFNNYYLGSYVD